MKINSILLMLALSFFSGGPVFAQVTLVKQQGTTVYLDTSDFNRHVSVGDRFKIITSREVLTNPVTGKELGMINHYSAEGKITEVQPLYAVGEAADETVYTVGQEAVIVPAATAEQSVSSAAVTSAQPAAAQRKIKSYDVIDGEIISAVQEDFTGQRGEEIAALDTDGVLILYTPDGTALKETARFKLPIGNKPLTLSAKDLLQSGQAQLFVTVYKESEQKITTLVFDIHDHAFKQIAQLPYFVKEVGCGDEKVIYAQKPFISGTRPGDVHPLTYENGRFKMQKSAFATRGNWLPGSHYYPVEKKDQNNFIYTAPNGRLRMRLANGKFSDSPALFATAPNRVKYKQQIVTFYPALQVYNQQDSTVLAGIENTAKFGLLSEQFGQYNGGKLHFLTYDNGQMVLQQTLELSGFAYDSSCTAQGILVPQVLSSGQTILAEIYR